MSRVVDTQRILAALGIAPTRAMVAIAERILGVARFEALCAQARVSKANADVRRQIAEVFAAANIGIEVTDSGDTVAARTGPLVFYSNHPYGFADALIALSIALARRPDTKVLANSALAAFDFHSAHTIWVDVGSGPGCSATNQRGLREALRHLRSGGALLIFPSQTCSHLRLSACCVTDPPWTPHLLALVDRAGASCVPLHFEGRNSWRFQLLGLMHPLFRTLLLLREFVGLEGRVIRVQVGAVMRHSPEDARASAADRMRRLRESVYRLGGADAKPEMSPQRLVPWLARRRVNAANPINATSSASASTVQRPSAGIG
jgi:putative hemolysin